MNTSMTPDEIEQQPFFHIPFWLQPHHDVFLQRSRRLANLAEEIAVTDHDWACYLHLLADICQIQQDLYTQLMPLTPVVKEGELPLSMNLIDQYADEWPTLFSQMHQAIQAKLMPTAQRVWQELLALSSTAKIALLKRVLMHQQTLAEQDYSIWVNALLQVVYTHAAQQLNQKQVQAQAEVGFCPCCGHDAVGAVIIGKGELAGLRYLCCDLCNSRWHMVRARCSFCDHDHDLGVHSIDTVKIGALSAAEAECCPKCHGYRKRYRLEKQQSADPIADDLVTLSLDILLSQEDWRRGGINPFLLIEKPIFQ